MVRHQNIPPRNRYVFVLFLTHLRTIQQTKLLFHRFLMVPSLIELDDGKIYRKTLYLMVKTMVSCRFSLKPIQWFSPDLLNPPLLTALIEDEMPQWSLSPQSENLHMAISACDVDVFGCFVLVFSGGSMWKTSENYGWCILNNIQIEWKRYIWL